VSDPPHPPSDESPEQQQARQERQLAERREVQELRGPRRSDSIAKVIVVALLVPFGVLAAMVILVLGVCMFGR
jgi:hypothetical protein